MVDKENPTIEPSEEERHAMSEDETMFTTAEMLDRVMAEDDKNDPHLEALQLRYGAKKP